MHLLFKVSRQQAKQQNKYYCNNNEDYKYHTQFIAFTDTTSTPLTNTTLMATSTAPNDAVTVNFPTFLMTIGGVVGENQIKVKNTEIQELPTVRTLTKQKQSREARN